MQKILHYLFLGVDYLLAFVLFGAGQLWALAPRLGAAEPVIPDTPGQRMVEQMGPGWNLANTLESFHPGTQAGLEAETSWGNPVTTPEMLAMVKAAGFTCVRVPATWGNHVIDDNYTIDSLWIDRVQEVVDYAYDIGLYVILNAHNDDYFEYVPDKANLDASLAAYTRIWEQIAERFRNYDERLLFEAINEPKVPEDYFAWKGGTPSQQKAVNRLHAAFVETVRASGGGNAARWLLLPIHAASYDPVTMRTLKLPKDDRLIVSIHAYYPWEFTEASQAANTYGEKEKKDLAKMLGRIYDCFVKKGVPVYLGEFGAADKNNTEDRVQYTSDYAAIAKRYGMNTAWWDNGLTIEEEFNGASFMLLDRSEMRWVYPEIVKAITGIEVPANG